MEEHEYEMSEMLETAEAMAFSAGYESAWNDAIEAAAALVDKKYGGMADGQTIRSLKRN